ncbi:winged helix-turn-helix transcriptional regulator [Streptomyces boninensis]|uniref:winged helix-turn-helix transcriptional regulator n=1 Tax=Streptomyces boninensis TaxID=2039455 RepID=UPI003B20CB97
MALGKDYASQECGIARALEIVGERWTLLVLRDAFYGVRRYNDFLTHLGIPRAVLAGRLQALTDAGVMEKRTGEHGRQEYVLTEAAHGLWPALHALRAWGREQTGNDPVYVFSHAACGTELGGYGECPKCAVPVPPGDVAMRRGPGRPKDPEHPVSRALERPHRLLEPLQL